MLDLSKEANQKNDGHSAYMTGFTAFAAITVIAGVLVLFIDNFGLTTNQKYVAIFAYVAAGMWICAGTQLRYYWRSPQHHWAVVGTIAICISMTAFLGWLSYVILA